MNEQQIFVAAIQFETEAERNEFLDQSCIDADVRERVDQLLRLHSESDLELDAPIVDSTDFLAGCAVKPGHNIGPYKLLEQIGEGGMGIVFMAEQTEPIRRRVAVKVIKPGMDSKHVIARFESERQAIAMMDHTNIAKVLDAGETESGHPFFVMELVHGISITDYCQRENVGLHDRLRLFTNVCRAVQHAHQKGIIHRDIKPSNILVTLHDGEPLIKMIDFGVARAMDTKLTDRTLFTRYAQVIGTPLYMSPEQADISSQDVDTRADVYSLGVLLYQLLTGSTPFDEERLRSASYDELRRIISEEEPPVPSARVETAGANLDTAPDGAQVNPARLSSVLRGELDWITIKALDKDRDRRYQTAAAFEADIQNFLNNDPVQACPPSRLYGLRKLVARNRTAVITALVFAVTLLTGTIVSATLAVRATRAEKSARKSSDSARREADIANSVSQFLESDLLRNGLQGISNHDISLREALDRASVSLNLSSKRYSPLAYARLQSMLGRAYCSINEQGVAQDHLEVAYAYRRDELGDRHRDTLKSAFELAVSKSAYDRVSQTDSAHRAQAAYAEFETILAAQQSALGSSDPDTLATMGYLATCYRHLGRTDEAEGLFAEANAGFETEALRKDPRGLVCFEQTIACLRALGKEDEAERVCQRFREFNFGPNPLVDEADEGKLAELREAVSRCEAAFGSHASETCHAMEQLGDGLLVAGTDFTEAKRVFEKVLAEQQRYFGSDDPRTFRVRRKLGDLHMRMFELLPARDFIAPTLAESNVDNQTLQTFRVIANLLRLKGQLAETAKTFGLLAETQARVFGPTDPRTIRSRRDEAIAWAHADNEEKLTQVILKLTEVVGSDHRDTINCQRYLGSFYHRTGNPAAGIDVLMPLHERAKATLGDDDGVTLTIAHTLADCYHSRNESTKALSLIRETIAKCETAFGERHTNTMQSVVLLGRILADTGKPAEAARLCERAAKVLPHLGGISSQRRGWYTAVANLAEQTESQGEPIDTDLHRQVLSSLAELSAERHGEKSHASADDEPDGNR